MSKAILTELASLREEVARLTTTVAALVRSRSRPSSANSRVHTISVGMPTAARMLDLHYDTVHEMVSRDVFTVLAPNGRGAGKRVYLFTDEIERYGETRDELAVRALRVEKGRLKKGRIA